jgi:hypothetical protein
MRRGAEGNVLALEKVGAIHSRRGDANPDLPGTELRWRTLLNLKRGFVSRLLDDDCFHR